MLTEEQVDSLVNLLHEDYHGSQVRITSSRFIAALYELKDNALCWRHVEFKRELKHLWDVIAGNINGNYNSLLKQTTIFMYSFELESREDKIYYSVFVLFHELRHHYQNKHSRLQRHDIEKDCNRFAMKMLDRYYSEIVKILE
jgi:hypothetical protein